MPLSKLVIVEDEFFAATHLGSLITSLGYEVVGIYHSGEDFLSETDWQFDGAILDVFLEQELTGVDLAKRIKEKGKPFIFLTANRDSETLREIAALNPSAYLSKPFQPYDVEAALTILSLKKQYQARDINSFYVFLKENEYTNEILTLREIELLESIMEGLTNKEIGEKLFISISTVKTHCNKIFHKFQVQNRQELKSKISGLSF